MDENRTAYFGAGARVVDTAALCDNAAGDGSISGLAGGMPAALSGWGGGIFSTADRSFYVRMLGWIMTEGGSCAGLPETENRRETRIPGLPETENHQRSGNWLVK